MLVTLEKNHNYNTLGLDNICYKYQNMSNTNKTNYLTLILLCLGYFIDFYDLTIMGVSYNELIKEQFKILDLAQIQQTYLLISNFQTAGIFIGAILFGWLGDKIGRASAIKYSILLYSLSTILAVYTHSLPIFIILRMLSYIGLAAEFSTSTVLILELFPIKSASWNSALLYSFGVLGGITATLIGMFSWKLMFLSGGGAGIILYIARARIKESAEYLYTKAHQDVATKLGSFKLLLINKEYILGIFKYLLMILPFYAIITMMFIFPSYIVKTISIASATRTLLMGFFIGNIISCFLSAIINNYYENYKASMLLMLVIFLLLMLNFNNINEKYLIFYSIGLGLIGGGYPISWAQQIAREYPTHIRSLASNILFALGRGSSIIFNVLISTWLIIPGAFKTNSIFAVIITFILALGSLYFSKNIYSQAKNFS